VRQPRPSAVLRALNDMLLSTPGTRTCSVAFADLQRHDGEWVLTLACGGHPLPVLLRAGDPPTSIGRPGTLLGAVAAARAEDVTVPMRPGDTVLLFTDGVPDGRDDGRFYGDERFAALLARHSSSGAEELVDALLEDLLEFQSDMARDDIALVAITVLPEPEVAGTAG
jgi:sigma-B regulation protein RsbU (phosphoserine phosphatase)